MDEEWTHGQVEGLVSPDTALLTRIEWLWIAVSAPFRGITALLTLAVAFIETLACLKHIVRTTLGTKCVFLSPFCRGYAFTHARESENVSHSVNRCHASAVQRIYLIFFLINGVVAKTLEQCAFHQEMKSSWVVSSSVAGSSPLHIRLP